MLSYLNPIPSLSKYPGPYKVGSTEYEIPVSEIPSSSSIPDPQITTIKFRLFYPTTSTASSKNTIYWLPSPQKQWTQAYASFMGASSRLSGVLSSVLSLLHYTTIPAVQDAPLHQRSDTSSHPVIMFSHGLGGNCNTYSSVVGALASCGAIAVAPEHRDGSAPISFVRSSHEQLSATIPYQKHSHSPSPEVLNARNAQLRIRLWELELIYTAISGLNAGKTFTNLVESPSSQTPSFNNAFQLTPGSVTWAGHSFGAATAVQLMKSVYYHQDLPRLDSKNSDRGGFDWTPLYSAAANSELVKQITPESPVALLDLWTMPLRGDVTKWLWEKPMPCYERVQSAKSSSTPNVVAIMSAEFYRWTDLLNRTRALLSQKPAVAVQDLERRKDSPRSSSLASPDITITTTTTEPASTTSSRTPSPLPPIRDSHQPSPASSQSSISSIPPTTAKGGVVEPHIYLIPSSAHLSQSDFGPLFPNVTRYAMKALEPEKTIELNVRAILAVMKGAGLDVQNLSKAAEGDDKILERNGLGEKERWVRIPLVE